MIALMGQFVLVVLVSALVITVLVNLIFTKSEEILDKRRERKSIKRT